MVPECQYNERHSCCRKLVCLRISLRMLELKGGDGCLKTNTPQHMCLPNAVHRWRPLQVGNKSQSFAATRPPLVETLENSSAYIHPPNSKAKFVHAHKPENFRNLFAYPGWQIAQIRTRKMLDSKYAYPISEGAERCHPFDSAYIHRYGNLPKKCSESCDVKDVSTTVCRVYHVQHRGCTRVCQQLSLICKTINRYTIAIAIRSLGHGSIQTNEGAPRQSIVK